MAKIIAIANQKGGVGKTTTCINLAAALSEETQRVLLIDLDPQGNATTGSGIDKLGLANSIYDVLDESSNIKDVIINLQTVKYDLLPANRDLTAIEVSIMNKESKENILKRALQGVNDDYDYVLIDCPPALSILTLNALVAADSVLIPMQCEFYALEGLADLLNSINGIAKSVNTNLKIEGVLRTMFDNRATLANDVVKQLRQYFGNKLYDSIIPRNIRLAEAPSYGIPAYFYDKQSKGAVAYSALAKEFLRKQA